MRKLYFSIVLFFFSQSLLAQYAISGKVIDQATGETLAGANLLISSIQKGTSSDKDGKFTLEGLKAGNYDLIISYIGYQTQKMTINLDKNTSLNIGLEVSQMLNDEVVVTATRATQKTPIAYKNVSKEEIEKQNLGQDIPFLLNQTPSVVVTSDAGAGIGYTGIRIRGTDPTRINVTINGIPLNDAESQGVFWVNMPDFASSVENIQIQRGVGTSTNGGAAFGATVNIQTNTLNAKPYAEIDNSYGSFNTWKHTVRAGSGLMDGKFTFDARLSQITSDGFIDRASSDLRSFYLSGAYYGKKSILRANVFSGQEQTYQAWNGIPEAELEAGNRTFNSGGTDFGSRAVPYDNEIDNYQQDHYQLFYTYQLNEKWNVNLAGHYTRGRGYFEQYDVAGAFADYGLADVVVGSETVTSSDFIRQRWLDNHFYGTVFSLNYESDKLNLNFGGGWNRYEGKHFGEIIWAEFATFGKDFRYYDNDAIKTDFNIYAKALYQFTDKINGFLDLQYRTVGYNFLGNLIDASTNGIRNVQQDETLNFFNPKVGLTYALSDETNIYASFAVGNKEPNRDDFTQSTPDSRPKHETMYNTEFGIRNESENSAWSVNFYNMSYDNQLVLTGQINDVGEANRVNIDNSFRRGVELEGAVKVLDNLQVAGNFTFSQNKVIDFKEFIDDFDNGGQIENEYSETDISFSPNVISSGQIEYKPFKNFTMNWSSKYVGEQFMDNTSNDNRKLDAFFVNDLRLNYNFSTRFIKNIDLTLMLNNVFAEEYEPNGYTFSYFVGQDVITENYYYPQAGRNFLVALGLKF